ncbi:MAG: A/G-specific adenine glycosylase [Prevotellaceae bacterium]|jgi:A/G-specific adenine glycosylase|nr:A/G-specific adenine glycosylase [Prevotellaceae bacterium]
MDFTATLLGWFKKNHRDLPWKNTKDPYKIWLSEIILQQTRVEQGYSYYLRFTGQYPTVEALAAAPLDEVLKLWQGLGYYSRARNLHITAQAVVAHHNGQFPTSVSGLLSLKGIGEYTAAAIASFAFDEPAPALDGNGYRILTRMFGIHTPIDSSEGKKTLRTLAQELISQRYPADFNQALMDFGSLVCVPKTPKCAECPLNEGCYAFRTKKVAELPVKSRKPEIRTRYFHYFIVQEKRHVYLHQRSKNDIWKGLYEFPLIETETEISPEKIPAQPDWKKLFSGGKVQIIRFSPLIKHQLTHQTLWARFYLVKMDTIPQTLLQHYLCVPLQDFERHSIPRLIDAFLEKNAENFGIIPK